MHTENCGRTYNKQKTSVTGVSSNEYVHQMTDTSLIRQKNCHCIQTRHNNLRSRYLPERHNCKPAVQAAAVMLRTPPPSVPITGQPATPTSHIRRAILRTPPSPPVTGQQRAHTPPSVRSMSSYHGMDASL